MSTRSGVRGVAVFVAAVGCLLTPASSLWVPSASAQSTPAEPQARVGDAASPDPAAPDPRGIERPEDPVAGQYVVTLRSSGASVPTVADALADAHDGTVVRTFSHALSGFTVQMSEAEAQALRADPSVASVAQDGYVHAAVDQTPAPAGLDRIDQRDLPLSGSYTYDTDGTGVTAYIIDSGIRVSHNDFGGRASIGVDLVGDGQNGNDCSGHGTHVAGTLGGNVAGVAKNVALVAVRVLDCLGEGTQSQVIAGVDWVTAHHHAPAVANLSLGGDVFAPLDAAVQASIASGVTYAIAAGNDGTDACGSSPARAPSALTVAATDSTDTRPLFSNYGTCVDLFAPGVGITSDWNAGDQATRTVSGTSVAAPHVAGTAALYLEANPGATPAQVASAVTTNATTNHVADPGPGSPNRLDYSGFIVLPVRIFGQDAIDTSIAVSRRAFATSGSAGAVVLSRSDFFSDALAGGPLAAVENAPLLITPGAPQRASLDPRVQAEIQRVLPAGSTVYILGGVLALAPGVDATLTGLGYEVTRVAGANQFSTAVAIAEQLGNPTTVFEATGLNFPDALSAVPAAIHVGGAILLTNGPVQAPETSAYLSAHPPTTRYAIGGPQAAAGADPTAFAVFGADAFGTSAAVAGTFFAQAAVFGAATGLNYPDALAGGVFMATGGRLGPMLLVNTARPVPAPIAAYLGSQALGTQGFVFGGPLAVGSDVRVALQAAIG